LLSQYGFALTAHPTKVSTLESIFTFKRPTGGREFHLQSRSSDVGRERMFVNMVEREIAEQAKGQSNQHRMALLDREDLEELTDETRAILAEAFAV